MSSSIVGPRLTGGSRFLEAGAGEAILFIHGTGQDAGFWIPQLDLFASSHRAIALDVEGEDPVAQARRLLDDLGIASANVVAHGEGGAIALALAAAHPQRVRRLALIDAGPLEGKASGVLCPSLIIAHGDDAALAAFLGGRLSRFDNRELRTAFGSFITGVTIVTTAGVDGQPRGFTANSFTSVSLEPPLLLICVGKAAASMDVFRHAAGFAVNILSEAQKETSVLFASKRPDKFEVARWRPGPYGNPLIEGSAAWFDCARYQVIDAGDHMVLMGHIEAFSYTDANPLGYARGHYITLGLEQAAVNAASSASRTVVGAILESDSRLVLLPDPARPDGLALPEAGRSGPNGSASQLHDLLVREGMDATLGFLFAVFENPSTREQCIYYRGEALLHARGRTVLADFEDIPWDRLPDDATRSMLRRYAAERKIGRFKVYSGDHRQGTVKAVD
jgi:flavin reductase (DIM6/NTAB) family NADH-FMN oxidoreductase RutF